MKMANKHSFRGLLHWATHRIPAVPAHVERPAGHQGTAVHGRARRRGAPHPSLNHRWNHSPAHPPRFMLAWQRRITAFFGREL
jgi:hypothetical protein